MGYPVIYVCSVDGQHPKLEFGAPRQIPPFCCASPMIAMPRGLAWVGPGARAVDGWLARQIFGLSSKN